MSDTKTRNFECEKHGEYEAHLVHAAQDLPFGIVSRDVWSGCPGCRAEREAGKAAAAERERIVARDRSRDAVGIPRRFSHAELGATGLHKTLREYADTLDAHLADGDGLVLIGPPGTGKTHALAAMLLHLADRHAEKVIARANGLAYRNAEYLGLDLRDTFKGRHRSEVDVLQPYLDARLLVLDEVGAAADDHARKSLATILCSRYEDARPTILAGNLSRTELEQYLGARVADRLAQSCRFIACTGPSKRRSPAPSTATNRGAA